MSGFNIELAKPEDAEFIINSNRAMAMETEDKTLEHDVISNGVRRLMEKPEYGFYVVAKSDDEYAGTLMVTTEWSDWRDGLFWWIQSVYVSPDFRRQGVYRKMYEFVKSQATQNPDVYGFRLYAERDNVKAQETYKSLGMSETPYLMFEEKLG